MPTLTSAPTRTPTITPTATPRPTLVPSGTILLKDDFANSASGWPSVDLGDIKFGYGAGQYLINVKTGGFGSYSLLKNRTFENVSLEVDVTLASGPSKSSFGILCRATAGDVLQRGYEFLITAGGNYGIVEVGGLNGDQSKILGLEGRSDVINKGNLTNHLRVDCSGGILTLYVNNQQLIAVQNSDFRTGQVGFAVSSSPDNPGFEVRFDNLVVREALQGVAKPTPCPPLRPNDKPSTFPILITLAKATQGANFDPVSPVKSFGIRDTFHAVVKIENAPLATIFKAIWYANDTSGASPCNFKLNQVEQVAEGSRNVDFSLKPLTTWAVGSYRVEVYVNGVLAQTTNFSVK